MAPGGAVTEAEARRLLDAWPGVGRLEARIAAQPWQVEPGGWTVAGKLQGWDFRLEVIAGGLRVTASAPGPGQPAVWTVTKAGGAP